jgi:hypothetical protein
MPFEISVVVAEASRLQAIRDGLSVPGRGTYFTAGNLTGAMESIRMYLPKLVAVDALWAQTPPGVAFIERVEQLPIVDGDIRLIARLDGRWVATPRRPVHGVVTTFAAAAASALAVVAPAPALVAAQIAAISTRRAPRFLVRDALNAVVENGSASLVDISVLGAQVVSHPVLRPNQRIKIALPDTDDMLHVTANVAWSTFEKPQLVTDAHYRAGLEFTGAAQEALEDYRRRHCADEPIPYRDR